jgi:hypothetical protein
VRRFMLAIAATMLALAPAAAAGRFTDALEFTEPGCEQRGRCILKHKFGYIDSNDQGWEAKAGNESDGASIPSKFQDWVGHPFDADLVRAAIIHDHYCDRPVRTFWDTHWVFYDALITSGVAQGRATLMYGAVMVGGPKWIWLIEGEPCQTGQMCIQEEERPSLLPQLRGELKKGGKEVVHETRTLLFRPARYSEPEFLREMEALQKLLAVHKGPVSRAEMEAMVKALRPNDPFITGPDAILRKRGVVK